MQRPRILYMVPDITDPAVRRRRTMFEAGGAQVAIAGFHRRPLQAVDGHVTGLGLTYDANFRQRMVALARWLLRPARLRQLTADRDVVVARNLEMLALARVALIGRPDVPLIYECLDVHRLMLGAKTPSILLRAIERWLMHRAGRVIISSPAFQRCYFDRYQKDAPAPLLVENRMLALDGHPVVQEQTPRRCPPPWRIGWFGMIRCKTSLGILANLAAQSSGGIEIIIRGRPTAAVFPDFEAEVRDLPGVTFGGAYHPAELAELYAGVDFVWGIDFFEAGQNSAWLLPNRLYEGGAFNRPIIAQDGVETARWLATRGAGLIVKDPATDLEAVFSPLTQADYARLVAAAESIPRSDLVCDQQDYCDLVEEIARTAVP